MDTRSCDRGVQQLVACIFVREFFNSSFEEFLMFIVFMYY